MANVTGQNTGIKLEGRADERSFPELLEDLVGGAVVATNPERADGDRKDGVALIGDRYLGPVSIALSIAGVNILWAGASVKHMPQGMRWYVVYLNEHFKNC